MNEFPLANRIKIKNASPDVDIHYGPWASVSDACANVPVALRAKGKTVGVIESNEVVEYQWKAGIADGDLVLKFGTGVRGKSAYDIAVDKGFVGTEAEWLLSLHGSNGTNGTDAHVPVGTVVMWAGNAGNIPENFHMCNGDTVAGYGLVPDLRGRFIVGYNPADTDYDTIGKTGGEKEHILTKAELPAINALGQSEPIPAPSGSAICAAYRSDGLTSNTANGTDKTAGELNVRYADGTFPIIGEGEAHENRPPYYTLAYIIKVANTGESSSADTMRKSVYDTTGNGIVDNAEKLEGKTKAQVIAEAQAGMVQAEAGKSLISDDERMKLASINEHWRGSYVSLQALNAAIPVGNPGDEATIDPGSGSAASKALWDSTDNQWYIGSTLSITTDQAVIEGSTNAVAGGAVFNAIKAKLSATKAAIEALLTGKIISHWHSFNDLEDAPVMTDYLKTNSTVANNSHASGSDAETHDSIGALINTSTAKDTLVDADMIPVMDSVDNNRMKKWSIAKLKIQLATLFAAKTHGHAYSEITEQPTTIEKANKLIRKQYTSPAETVFSSSEEIVYIVDSYILTVYETNSLQVVKYETTGDVGSISIIRHFGNNGYAFGDVFRISGAFAAEGSAVSRDILCHIEDGHFIYDGEYAMKADIVGGGGGTVDADTIDTILSRYTNSTPADSDYVVGIGKKKFSLSAIVTYLRDKFDIVYAAASHSHAWSAITGKPTFSTVATSGSYNDLNDRPNLGALDDVIEIGNWEDPSRPSPNGTLMYDANKLWERVNSSWVERTFSISVFYLNADSTITPDTYGKVFRYNGVNLAIFGDGLTLGTTASTAHRGDHGNAAYQHSQSTHAPAGAQVNVIESISVGGVAQTITNKNIDLTIPNPDLSGYSTTNERNKLGRIASNTTDSIAPDFAKDIWQTTNTGTLAILIDTFSNLPTFGASKLLKITNSRASSMAVTFRTSNLAQNNITYQFVNFSASTLNIPAGKKAEISYLFDFVDSTNCMVHIIYAIQP